MNDTAKELWEKVLSALGTKVSEQMIEKLLRPVEPLDAADATLLLRAPNDFHRDWVTKAYVPVLEQTLKHLTTESWQIHWAACVSATTQPIPRISRPASQPSPTASQPRQQQRRQPGTVTVSVAGTGTGAPTMAINPPPPRELTPTVQARSVTVARSAHPSAAHGAVSSGLSPRYTFDRFVIGPSNQVAHAAALATSDLTDRRVPVLFLCGPTGLGKTHLSNAVGHCILEQRPEARIAYVSAENFTNDYVRAIQTKKMEEFRARFRYECDALLIDDVQFLAGREGTQEEFFHTFNTLQQRGAPIVLTSDVLPEKLQGMAERLLSRFASGLVAEVYPPEVETRVAILQRKAELSNIKLDDDAAFLIASAIPGNVRELEGALARLSLQATITHRPSVDAVLVRDNLRIGPRPTVVTVEEVQRAVCDHYKIKMSQLTGKERHREVALARQMAMYLARTHLGTSFPQLGVKFNGKDHTTVMAAVRKIEKVKSTDPDIAAAIETLVRRLGLGIRSSLGPGSNG